MTVCRISEMKKSETKIAFEREMREDGGERSVMSEKLTLTGEIEEDIAICMCIYVCENKNIVFVYSNAVTMRSLCLR